METQPQAQPKGERHGLRQAENELFADCVAALERAVPPNVHVAHVAQGETRRAGPFQPDALLRLQVERKTIEYVIEVKRTLRDAAIGPITHWARECELRGQRLLLFADRVPDRLGNQLRDQGVDYLDADGNAHLHGPGILVWIQGRKPTRRPLDRTGLRGTDVRLLGVFLRDPDAGEQVQTELARRAGIALGAVGDARKHLVGIGILGPAGGRRWNIRDRAAGLRLFGDGWAARVRDRLRPRTYRFLDGNGTGTLEERIAAAEPGLGILLGGERAAAQLTGFLETDHATLHVPREARRRATDALGLVPVEGGPITLLDRYGAGDGFVLDALPGTPLIHPLWVWAECLTVRDERVAQTAQLLLKQWMSDG